MHYLPSGWHEVSAEQAKQIITSLFVEDTPKVRMTVLMALLQVKWDTFTKIHPATIYEIIQLIGFIWTKPLFECPLKSFIHAGVTYFLPDPYLNSMSVIEYHFAEQFLTDFASGNQAALDLLLGTICRPLKKKLNRQDPDWDGDQREKYNSAISEDRAKLFAALPLNVKLLVLQYFISSKKSLYNKYKPLFQSKGGSGESKKPLINLGWLGCIYDLADAGTFGDFEKTAFANIHTICVYLLKKHFERKEQEQNS